MMNRWEDFLKEEFNQAYFKDLSAKLKVAYQSETIYPPRHRVFEAFARCPYDQLKVVILGQDPYHQPGQAHGLAFSVPKGIDIPPSLRNIFQELNHDVGCPIPNSGDLSAWANQGVLLLNSLLSVQAGQPLSHKDWGWVEFTDRVLKQCNAHPRPLVFILWGKTAQAKRDLITDGRHLILSAPHPSPLSAYQGFFGSRPFTQVNDFLVKNGQKTIQWCL